MTVPKLALYVSVVVCVVLGFYALFLVRAVLFLFLVAVLIATAIEPLVFRLRRGPFSHAQGILIVYSGIMLAIFGLGAVIVPILVREVGTVSQTYAQILDNLRNLVYSLDQRLLGPAAEKAVAKVASPDVVQDEGTTAITVGLTLIEGLFAAVTVFVVAFYWLTERMTVKRAFTSLFPRRQQAKVGAIWRDVERVLGGWVRGQLLLMLFIGVMTGIGYTLFGLNYALILAVVAALCEIVPLVGPYLGAIPAILVALTQNVQLALVVAGYILIVQLIEGNILVPRVMERTAGVSPLTVIMGLLIGASLGGIPGALVAVPVAAAIQVVLQHVLEHEAESPAEVLAPGVVEDPDVAQHHVHPKMSA